MQHIVLANGVKNRQRRAMELFTNAPGDFVGPAARFDGEASGPTKNLELFNLFHLRKIRLLGHLILMSADEPFDAAEQEANAAATVGENKPPRRQTAATPALNRFAGDVESLGDVIDRKHRLGNRRTGKVERDTDLFDELAEIMLQRKTGQQVAVAIGFGVICSDSENNEIQRIRALWFYFVEKCFSGGELLVSNVRGGKPHLASEVGKVINSITRHDV
jgi:hypothetical protein